MKTRAFLFTALLATGLFFSACSKEKTPSTEMDTTATSGQTTAPTTPSADTNTSAAPSNSTTTTTTTTTTTDSAGATVKSDTMKMTDTAAKAH